MKKFLLIAVALVTAAVLVIMPSANAAIYQQGVVYVIYDENIIKDKADVNSNGVPDIVEDIATQVNAVREVYKDVFHYPDPLNSERFPNVTSIEIDIADRSAMKVAGSAFSSVRKKSKHDPNQRALHIKLANTVNPHKNPTPAHEYFHLVQYGATYFGNGWYLEGMARWSEDSVSAIKSYPDAKNFNLKFKDKAAQNELFQEKYDAAKSFWYPLAVSRNDKATIPDGLINKYRYVDGSAVFHDNIFYGANVMREVLKVMKSKEGLAVAQFEGDKKWTKERRRHERNNVIIFEGIRELGTGNS